MKDRHQSISSLGIWDATSGSRTRWKRGLQKDVGVNCTGRNSVTSRIIRSCAVQLFRVSGSPDSELCSESASMRKYGERNKGPSSPFTTFPGAPSTVSGVTRFFLRKFSFPLEYCASGEVYDL